MGNGKEPKGLRRLEHFAAMVLIGDGVMAMVRPRRDARAWKRGPAVWRASMEYLAERPALTRGLGALEAVGAVLWMVYRSEQ